MSRYRSLLRLPGAHGLVAAGLIGRFPMSMLGIGTVLLVQAETDSYALAGSVSGTLSISTALAGPLTGSLADRWGQRRLLRPMLAVFAVATAGLVLTVVNDRAPLWLAFPVAVVVGAGVPQIGSLARRRWRAMVGHTVPFGTALSLESVLDAVSFMIGPVLAAFLATRLWSAAGVAAAVTLAVVGGVAFIAQRHTEPAPRPPSGAGHAGSTGPYRVRGVWVLVAGHLGMGMCFGSSDLCVIAFAQLAGHGGMAGVFLAAFAVGSVVAGIGYGAVGWRAAARTRWWLALVGMALTSVLLVLAGSIVTMLACAVVYGLTVSPALIGGTELMESLVPADSLTEGFAWLTAATGLGIALGSSLAGPLIDAYGPNQALLLTTAAAAAAATAAALGRTWLSAGPVPLPESGQPGAAPH